MKKPESVLGLIYNAAQTSRLLDFECVQVDASHLGSSNIISIPLFQVTSVFQCLSQVCQDSLLSVYPFASPVQLVHKCPNYMEIETHKKVADILVTHIVPEFSSS
jgi:hypothetical protein